MIGQTLWPSCGKLVYVNDDGALRVHGKRNNRCPGRGVPPKCPECEAARGERRGMSYYDSKGDHDHMNAHICTNAFHEPVLTGSTSDG